MYPLERVCVRHSPCGGRRSRHHLGQSSWKSSVLRGLRRRRRNISTPDYFFPLSSFSTVDLSHGIQRIGNFVIGPPQGSLISLVHLQEGTPHFNYAPRRCSGETCCINPSPPFGSSAITVSLPPQTLSLFPNSDLQKPGSCSEGSTLFMKADGVQLGT